MGLEYHDRQRDRLGRFVRAGRHRQVHVYCDWHQWRIIKAAALAAGEDMSQFCRRAAMRRAEKLIARDNPETVKTVPTDDGVSSR